MLDIDDFKKINDTYGHNEGDKVLEKLGIFLSELPFGKAFRLGGDEFVILVEESKYIPVILAFIERNCFIRTGIKVSKGAGKNIIEADKLLYENKRKKKSNSTIG